MNKINLATERHPSLPAGLNAEQLAEWLRNSAVDHFTDTRKTILTQDEIHAYEHESVLAGREINRMEDLLSQVRDHVKKGSEEKLKLVIPATVGIKQLTTNRRENDDMLELGAIEDKVELFGIPNAMTEEMEYFDMDGNIVADRTRKLSAREKHEHLGMFQNVRDSNARIAGADENGELGESKMFIQDNKAV